MKNRLPVWFRQEIPGEKTFSLRSLLSEFKVHTVCQEAKCPNINHCFGSRHVTFMLLGDACTRNCRFCNVGKAASSHLGLDANEPLRIAEAVKRLGLKYAVVTSVTRDDLADGGAGQFVRAIEAIRLLCPQVKIEILIPDFQGNAEALRMVIDAGQDVMAHNLETVKRLYNDLRPQADYQRSLEVLSKIKKLKPDLTTKSSLMLGLGETEREVIEAMQDLRDNRCDILTLGQYLAPSEKHYPVKEFVSPEQFTKYRQIGLNLGFKSVLSGPLVRSSYQAEEVYQCMT